MVRGDYGIRMTTLPLQVVDTFLLPYELWQVLVLLFALVMLASLPLRSRQVLAVNALLFGVLFAITPITMATVFFRFFGFALILVAPLLYVTAEG